MTRVYVKLVHRTSKTSADGTAPIYLRVTANRRKRYKSTGVKVRPKHWNEKRQQVRATHELASAYNNKLDTIRLTAERAALEADSCDPVIAAVEGHKGSLTAFFERWIARLKSKDSYWRRRKYEVTLRKLRAACGDDIDFAELDRDALETFERYCRDERGNAVNTTRKELSRVGRVMRQAIKEGVVDASENPFDRYDMPERQPVEKRRLSRTEMQRLEEADLPAANLEGDPERAMLARDVFVFAFYAGGMRFGDLCRLKPDHVKREGDTVRLQYRMMKTGQPVDLPLPRPAQAIMQRWADHAGPYLFPILTHERTDPEVLRRRISSRNVQLNRALKRAVKAAGIDKPDSVTMHVARHSFADFARSTSSDLYAVSKALGHSSLKITENYLSDFDREATDKLANDMWGE
ncbi:MAG: site-specific integrase [Longimonas sp.]|uniref:site-specific integrase n=1 Tax=Longimonas sp. TaxID=2039626 RepID=UPI003359E024